MRRTVAGHAGVTVTRVVASEWTKLAGLRAPVWVVVATVAAAAALAAVLGMFLRPGDGGSGATLVVSGHLLVQLGPLVLGVLVGAGEYGAGTATTTFTAVPRRLPVLAAQVAVTAVVALGTAAAAVAAAAWATAGVRAGSGLALDLGDGETARVLAGYVLSLTGVALLGLGLGALLRRPAAAFGAAALLLVVVDHLLATNPGRVTDTVRALLPGAGSRLLLDDAGLASLDAASLGPDLGPWGGGVVLGLWVAGLLAAAALRLRRGDVV
ncbi:hypothetical protein LEP48_14780 [Isoptericola sp. NEAU-Y5]|uniref:ABC-2 type transport system permease protein n=1 Tax=Isoptericola luteus TaxID=2879484 RepID=A0ABS7ZHV4_9MICO|nr:hypothetical protein [Isoptericola sp. NEAU-Y5]MCA5891769.1 hypothetical protein [Isoptericola sp. NEAU-Y5]MCA5894602.1 hypothetical protein [Isoptericola sp. NEAU-Y5]